MAIIAPHIYRQRAYVEGTYLRTFTANELGQYMVDLSNMLEMTILYGPAVMRQAERIDPKYKGYEAVMIWAESGCQVYTWEDGRFFSVDVYSCKPFDEQKVMAHARKFFKATEIQIEGIARGHQNGL